MTVQWFEPTGPAIPALAGIDDAMKALMIAGDIRGGAIAVVHAGRLVHARGYTYAEPGYRTTMPTDLFRIASTTKPLTSLLIYQLIEAKQLAMTDKVQGILGLKTPGGAALTFDPVPADKQTDGRYFNAITVEHLLRHQGGWYHGADWTFHSDAQIASVFGVDLPITKYQIASQAAANNLSFYPGSQTDYSNLGYNLLGMVIEHKLSTTYTEAVRQRLFTPLGITRPRMSKAALEDRAPGEVEYHFVPPTTVQSVVHKDRRLVPEQYGGENNANFDAFGGWLMAAPDYARVLAAFMQHETPPMPNVAMTDMLTWAHGTRPSGVHVVDHGGVVGGACSYVAARGDGNGFVLFINKSGMTGTYSHAGVTYGIGDYEPVHRILDAVTQWPAHDMFPALLGGAPEPDCLYDGVWSPSAAGQFVSWGKTPAQHSALYNEWWGKGFRLIHQQAYVVNGQLLYDAIWNPNTGGQFVTWGKSLATMRALYDQQWQNGFKLIHVQSYKLGNQVLYDGIWQPDSRPQLVAWSVPQNVLNAYYAVEWPLGMRLVGMNARLK